MLIKKNDTKLLNLLVDVLLIDESEYKNEFGPNELETWDSLAMVRIIEALEQEFNLKIKPEEMILLESIGDIKYFLSSRGIDIKE